MGSYPEFFTVTWLQACPGSSRTQRYTYFMGTLGLTLIPAHSHQETAVGIDGRSPKRQSPTDVCSLCWSTLPVGLRGWAPELGANHGLNLPRTQQNAALWFMAVSFFSGTFVLGSPDTPPMADVPKVTGPDFPVPDGG